jgi:hypothetical protein
MILTHLPKSLKWIYEAGLLFPYYVLVIILLLLADDSNTIKAILTRLTRRSTFPNIILRGHSIGGSDDIHELHTQKRLSKMLEEAGVVQQNDGYGQ